MNKQKKTAAKSNYTHAAQQNSVVNGTTAHLYGVRFPRRRRISSFNGVIDGKERDRAFWWDCYEPRRDVIV